MALMFVVCVFAFYICGIIHGNVEPPQNISNKVANKPNEGDTKTLKLTQPVSLITNQKVIPNPTNGPNIKSNSNTYVESGAVLRGVFVFVAIALLFITYLVFKTYRKTNKKKVSIKKYGVKARRTDTEMEPLHLDDDEEDETLFELHNVNK